ncbi:heme exporter protein CcmB [Saccharibacter sp. 17.LH.SD]|uniref:heme exporter protein CcmB n=1 Tax=Saccharibacter sp. 17.LH.SD TaxID=2689393 RepID=UPI0013721848|nr:heme exporter protein CcmB [Saccharibacter sp. 17.LH.SD]MXV43849.1 heme exporter protein CcmB [Saccharibacter sp. 17.LH.SD]
MVALFITLIRRELRLAFYFGSDTLGGLFFFILCSSLFPLALGPSPSLLHMMGPGIIWVCALLASLLPLERLFAADYDDGSLDLLMLSGLPPAGIALAKIVSHWLTSSLPILLTSVPLGIMFSMQTKELLILLGSLTLGSLTFSLIGGTIAASILGARRNTLILPLLVLPLNTPVLIFGALSSYAMQIGASITTNLSLLGACLCLALPFCPLAAGAGLREACR